MTTRLLERAKSVVAWCAGFGLSEKPTDHAFSIIEQADIAQVHALHSPSSSRSWPLDLPPSTQALLAHVAVNEVHVLAHDYGDTVGQELLARHNERSKAGDATLIIKSLCFLNGGRCPHTRTHNRDDLTHLDTCVLGASGLFPGAHRPRLVQTVMAQPHIGKLLGYTSARCLRPSCPLPRALTHLLCGHRYVANYWTFCRTFVPVFGEQTAPTEAELREMWYVKKKMTKVMKAADLRTTCGQVVDHVRGRTTAGGTAAPLHGGASSPRATMDRRPQAGRPPPHHHLLPPSPTLSLHFIFIC
jgi:pimeloyl-ACP methyl ester carboxylesterase